MDRPSKVIYYLEMAKAASIRSTCLRSHVGVVIVQHDQVVSTGYNGAPRGRKNCIDIGECYRVTHNIPSGTHYECCRAVHGEMNAIIDADRSKMLNASMYVYQFDVVHNCVMQKPGICQLCQRMIINAGINEVILADPTGIGATPNQYGYRVVKVRDWVSEESFKPLG